MSELESMAVNQEDVHVPAESEAIIEQIKKWVSVDNKLSILVAGETGAGKSSLVNKIFGANVASTDLGPTAVQKDVSCYTKILHTSAGCITVLIYDTPGLNDTDLTAEQICKMMVEKTAGCVHVLIYCIDITNRFRESDKKLLTNVTKNFGKGIWDCTVFALTKADVALVCKPEADLDALRDEFKKCVHSTLTTAGVPDETVKAIPFALTAARDDFVPPECQQGGENEIRNWYWKEQLLLYIFDRVDPRAAFALLELHQSTLTNFLQNHPYIAGVGTFALGTAVLAATGFVGSAVAVGAYLALGGTAAAGSVTSAVVIGSGIGVGSKVGSMLQGVVSRKLHKWFETNQE